MQGETAEPPGIIPEAPCFSGDQCELQKECKDTLKENRFSPKLIQDGISLLKAKTHSLTRLFKTVINCLSVTLRKLSRLLGIIVVSHPALLPEPLHYRNLETARSTALNFYICNDPGNHHWLASKFHPQCVF